MKNGMEIEVEIDTATGPRVRARLAADQYDSAAADAETQAILAEVPEGWDVDWSNAVRTDDGRWSWPLVEANAPRS